MDLWQKLDEKTPGTASAQQSEPPAKRLKHSFAASKKDAYTLRKSAGNPIYHAYLMYADQENLFKMWIIYRMSMPLMQWHQQQNVELRSTESGKQWLISQCKGDYIRSIQDTVDAVHMNNLYYENMGITSQWPSTTTFDADSAEGAQQDSLAGHIGDFALGVVQSRINWGADFLFGIARRACLILDEKEGSMHANDLCGEIRIDLGLLAWAKRQPDLQIQAWAAESAYALPCNQQLV